jgi:hypothetical protein
MTEADRLSENANVPHGLAELVVIWSEKQGRTLRQVRSECRDRDLVWIRRMVAREARRRNYSFPQIGRALNRDPLLR